MYPQKMMPRKYCEGISKTWDIKKEVLPLKVKEHCINISCHVFMGRLAARLEMSALVNQTYVLVENIGNRNIFPPMSVIS